MSGFSRTAAVRNRDKLRHLHAIRAKPQWLTKATDLRQHRRVVTMFRRRRSTMNAKVTPARSFVRAPAAGSTLNVLGATHVYKATADETGGFVSLWEAVFPPGTGAPPH